MMHIVALILAGGTGERFWPRSRRVTPKQFLSISGDKSLLQETIDRILPVVDAHDIFVVTGENLESKVVQQLPGVPRENIIIEPCARSTAACIALAAADLEQRYEDPANVIMIVLPSDHVVRDPGGFCSAVRAAIEVAAAQTNPLAASEVAVTRESSPASQASRQPRSDRGPVEDGSGALPAPLVTLGIWPTRPETGYGYIHLGNPIRELSEFTAYHATEFIEKPDAVRAQRFLADGHYLWNSGVFIWRLDVILRAFEMYMPTLGKFLSDARVIAAASLCEKAKSDCRSDQDAIDGASSTQKSYIGSRSVHPIRDGADVGSSLRLKTPCRLIRKGSPIYEEYRQLESISIDYGILEKASPIAVIPCGFGWDDVGTWPALERVAPVDDNGNVVLAHHIGIDTRNCIIVQDINGNGGALCDAPFVDGKSARNTETARYGAEVTAQEGESGEGNFPAGITRPVDLSTYIRRTPSGRLIATLGVDNLVIVETPDATLICRKDRAADIRALVSELKCRGWSVYL